MRFIVAGDVVVLQPNEHMTYCSQLDDLSPVLKKEDNFVIDPKFLENAQLLEEDPVKWKTQGF